MKQTLSFTLLIVTALSAAAQYRTECSVRGTVVDRSGKPVPNAYLILDIPPEGWEDLISLHKSGENGDFEIRTDCPFPGGKMNLYVSSPFSFENFSPFTAPFLRSTKLGKPFAGQPVINRTKRDVNLGNVPVQVNFSTVLVRFADQSGDPLIKEKQGWYHVWIRVRLGKTTVAESTLAPKHIEKAVRVDQSAVTMSLPEGEWTIELSPDGKHWLTPDKTITVTDSAPQLETTLKMLDK